LSPITIVSVGIQTMAGLARSRLKMLITKL
jgi:hypothetical protein